MIHLVCLLQQDHQVCKSADIFIGLIGGKDSIWDRIGDEKMLQNASFSEVEQVLQLTKDVTAEALHLYIGTAFRPKYLLNAKYELAKQKAQNPLSEDEQA